MLRTEAPGRQAGFTIAEFLLVAFLVGALITIAIVSVSGIDDQSAERECQTELRAIKAATEQFHAELNFYPPNDKALKDANLMGLDESPNWNVVTPDGATEPRFEPVGTRCA